MAKLMSPNIRIDWYPEDTFSNPLEPTVNELNRGNNISSAIVTGFTLDFTDSQTEQTTTVFDMFETERFSRHSYEGNLQFFLAPRGSTAGNEAAFRLAEELFYTDENPTGYLVKRFGYKCDEPYSISQMVDIFKFQANLPKVLTEEGAPILLEISYIPKGVAGAAITPSW